MNRYYLRVEGVNLNNFVYDTNDLSTIRGGSLILLDSIEYLSKSFAGRLTPLTTGASTGLFRFDADDIQSAENMRDEVIAFLRKNMESGDKQYELKYATFVVDIQPDTDDFLHDYESIVTKNRWRQMQQPSLAIPSQNNDWKDYCDIDLVRPAAATMEIANKNTPVSASVKTRREYGITQKYKFYRMQTGLDIGDNFTHDLEDLTADEEQGNLHHKMAVIYIDGNSFGKLRREKCDTEDKLRHFDEYIKNKRKSMFTGFLQNLVMRDKKGWVSHQNRYRVETLLWGGDEILWVVPAWQGWETLSFFYQAAQDWHLPDGMPLTHAAGIVFCHHNAAINRIKKLAHDLAERAKKDRTKNLFAYQVLESFDHIGRDLDDFRRQRCPKDNGSDNSNLLLLNGEQMADIEKIFTDFKSNDKFPKRQMYRIVKQLLDDPLKAQSIIDSLDAGIREKIPEIAAYFNRQDMVWVHLQELWDYVGV
jgi:hypothetical protein